MNAMNADVMEEIKSLPGNDVRCIYVVIDL